MIVEEVKIALASSSPRRREILELVGFKYRVLKSQAQEVLLKDPLETALENSKRKLLSVKDLLKEKEVGLSADTVVVLDGEVLGKPKDPEGAISFLKRLSGRWHRVITAFSLLLDGKLISEAVSAEVKFKRLTFSEIKWYVSTGEPMDKAGAYGVQGKGALFIEELRGDFFTVMGLPIGRIYDILDIELKSWR
ncbi:nucleoside triphosphate pyrophosphatase [Thermovibrio sp.]